MSEEKPGEAPKAPDGAGGEDKGTDPEPSAWTALVKALPWADEFKKIEVDWSAGYASQVRPLAPGVVIATGVCVQQAVRLARLRGGGVRWGRCWIACAS